MPQETPSTTKPPTDSNKVTPADSLVTNTEREEAIAGRGIAPPPERQEKTGGKATLDAQTELRSFNPSSVFFQGVKTRGHDAPAVDYPAEFPSQAAIDIVTWIATGRSKDQAGHVYDDAWRIFLWYGGIVRGKVAPETAQDRAVSVMSFKGVRAVSDPELVKLSNDYHRGDLSVKRGILDKIDPVKAVGIAMAILKMFGIGL